MIDWAEVRRLYLKERSYKIVAERFGLSPERVKKRAQRGHWAKGDGGDGVDRGTDAGDGAGARDISGGVGGTDPAGREGRVDGGEGVEGTPSSGGVPRRDTDTDVEGTDPAPNVPPGDGAGAGERPDSSPEHGSGDNNAGPGSNGVPPLRRPGITADTLHRAGIRLSDHPEPGSIEIPYFTSDGRPTTFKRWRLARERPDGQKYHQPAGTGVHVYHPPIGPPTTADGDLVIAEGEFKALSLVEAGIAAIGLPGIGTYTREDGGEPELLPGIRAAIDRRRPARILFLGDSDTATNHAFSRSAVVLSASVHPLPVALPRIPIGGPGKGIDDCRQALDGGFDGFWRQIVESAEPLDPKSSPGQLAARLLEREFDALAASRGAERDYHQRRVIRMIAEVRGDPASADRMTRLCSKAFGIGLRSVTKAVKHERARIIDEIRSDTGGSGRPGKSAGVPVAIEDLPPRSPWGTDATGAHERLVGSHGDPFRIVRSDEGEITILGYNPHYWAARFAFENLVIYEPHSAEFFCYLEAKGLWQWETEASVRNRVSEYLLRHSRLLEIGILDTDRTPEHLGFMLTILRALTERRSPFKKSKGIIHLQNGMLHLDTPVPELRAFSPHYFSLNQCTVAFDQSADCPRFLDELVLPSMEPDDAELLQTMAGLYLLGRNILQVMLIMVGTGGSGKGAIARVITGIIGIENVKQLRTHLLDERFELDNLDRVTLLVGSDVAGDFLSSRGAKVIKALTGGDPLTVESKGGRKRDVIGLHNVLITSNDRLRVALDGDESAWRRRMAIIPFYKTPAEIPMPDLDAILLAQEGSGILNWMLVGAARVMEIARHGGRLHLSPRQQERVDVLLAESDSLRMFVKNAIVRDPEASVTLDEFQAAYENYCSDRRWLASAKNWVERSVGALMMEFHRAAKRHDIDRDGKPRRGFTGVRIAPPDERKEETE